MLKFVLLIPAILLLALGGEGVYNARRGRDVANLTCAQLQQAPPPTLSLRLTGCEIDYQGAAYRESNGAIDELFLPARAVGAPANQPAPIVIATTARAVLAIAQPVVNKSPAPSRSLDTIKKAATAAGLTKEIRGLVRAGFMERIASRQVLAGLSTPLTQNVMLLDLNASPSYLWPLALVALGSALLFAAGLLMQRSRRPAPAVPVEIDRDSVLARLTPYPASGAESNDTSSDIPDVAETATPPSGPVLVAVPTSHPNDATTSDVRGTEDNEVRLPQVMLLKLDSSVGPEAIEMAPPLGTKDDVTARLREVLPDLEIDNAGRGNHEGPDHALAVDLGRHDMVHTAILDARGKTGISAVKWVLETTGWRAFVPKTGRFVDAEGLEDLVIRDTPSST